MTPLNSYYALAAQAPAAYRRYVLGAGYSLYERVMWGESYASARARIMSLPQYSSALIAAGLDDDLATVDSLPGQSQQPFSPADVAGLWTWLKADAVTGTSNGAALNTWADSSGNGRNATAGAGVPTYQTNVVNGQPAVRFNGIDTFYSLPSMAALTAGTVFVVLKRNLDPPVDGNKTGLWVLGSDPTLPTAWPWTDGIIYEQAGTTARKTTVDPGPSLASWGLYMVRSAANDWSSYLNGTQLFSTATNTVGFHASPRLGAHTATFLLDGDVAEFLLYSTAVSATDRDSIEAYLASKYGLTVA